MQEFLNQLVSGVRDAWQRLSRTARINLGLAAAGVFVFIVLIVVFATRPQYVQLYSGLNQDDSLEIRTYLQEQNIGFEVQEQGGTILVPASERSRLMLELRDRDLPAMYGTVPGFELFDTTDLMTNRYLQDINYMRAVQGELQNTLNALDFVNKSYVFIREAEDSYFLDYQKPSEASVVLDVRRRPTDTEVQALLSMISSFGGAELDQRNITLTLSNGTPLYIPPRDEFAALAGSQLEHQLEVERIREEKVMSALRDAGVQAVVRVAAKIDSQRVQERTRQAAEGAIVSTQELRSTIDTTERLPEGPVGATANPPEGAQVLTSQTYNETTNETIENFEPSIIERETTINPGNISGYSVTAFIDGGTAPELNEAGEPTGNQVYRPLTEDEIDKYKVAIAGMIGPDVTPEDVAVYDHPMEAQQLLVEPGLFSPETLREFVTPRGFWLFVQILALVVGFLMIRRFLLRAIVVPEEEVEGVSEADLAEERADVNREIMERLERAAAEEPEMVAAILRAWITEESREER